MATPEVQAIQGVIDQNKRGTEEEKLFKCVPCNKSYIQNKDLNKHMRKKHPEQWLRLENEKIKSQLEGEFKCNACEKCFQKEQALKDHRRRHHTKEELFYARTQVDTWKCGNC